MARAKAFIHWVSSKHFITETNKKEIHILISISKFVLYYGRQCSVFLFSLVILATPFTCSHIPSLSTVLCSYFKTEDWIEYSIFHVFWISLVRNLIALMIFSVSCTSYHNWTGSFDFSKNDENFERNLFNQVYKVLFVF